MSLVDRVRGDRGVVPVDVLVRRISALQRFVTATNGAVPDEALTKVRAVTGNASERLRLSGEHTVVALAGATGSGKSSLFNLLASGDISPVGVRRPTTGNAYACVWGYDGAGPLLDWLRVPQANRFAHHLTSDADEHAALAGLVLLDLPDFDSVLEEHRLEVDRLLSLVDLVVWVTDPQKYADQVIHERYLRTFRHHRDITVVLLNQADRLSPADTARCVNDLARLLAADGLATVPVFAVSAVGQPGAEELRNRLARSVAARHAALTRLAADVDEVVGELSPLVEADLGREPVSARSVTVLVESLTAAAGLPAVADATVHAYRHRAMRAMGWPVTRWLRRARPDPLRRLHLEQPADATSLPAPAPAERSAVALAVRTLAEQAAKPLPEPWPEAVLAAARSRVQDLPDALDTAIARTDLGLTRSPWWWRLVGAVQWLATVAALAGLAWLVVRLAFVALALPDVVTPKVGALPLPTLLLFGGLTVGVLVALLVRPLVAAAARRAGVRASRRLRTAVEAVAEEYVVAPLRAVLARYTSARAALSDARR
ncbi:MAG TPA: GTPase [Micromonosporaceae bacterium]